MKTDKPHQVKPLKAYALLINGQLQAQHICKRAADAHASLKLAATFKTVRTTEVIKVLITPID